MQHESGRSTSPEKPGAGDAVRERILDTASGLFYREGVRAVGVDLVVAAAGVAKTSLYRHFRTKDDLVAAFLTREDADFWRTWDEVADKHRDDPSGELQAHMDWIGERVGRPNYRGCPQLNVAAEFPQAEHPARRVATAHKLELRRRLLGIAQRMGVARSEELAGQLAVLINGAFVSGPILSQSEAKGLLRGAAQGLVEASKRSETD
ncbi:TetR family transcriptional regulator [Caulobacter sp. Root1455]|uniref:TetR/AcrR family transcriptional regulator n=1 Tax=unclassified Caulobacter TaxID=2648921 RepID=UPI0006FF480F|nr:MULTISPECIES: TetR/AcrR family transcriptional regulator [unclassified Caulobacter]KQY27485.1 TetR family transcriptional regulator [Caulobacter sp. Root487D2Y]KQY92817.1 TetR family transcriptional regulator [Caulobacter sp. Root1455]